MDPSELEKYKDMAIRRIWWIIIPILLSVLITAGYCLKLPKIYRASTLILVQSPKVPAGYVQEIVSIDSEERLRTITHQITSRTNLENIIKKFNLFQDPNSPKLMEDKVANLRNRITVDVSRSGRQAANAFQVFFSGKHPQQVANVTNALASYFITENLKLREDQAIGTSEFLLDELEIIKKRLAAKEAMLKEYREKYMGGLPEQLETNLRILERIQQQIVTNQENLREAENRKLLTQQQISEAAEIREARRAAAGAVFTEEGETQPTTLDQLKNQLASLEAKYTQKHPDVVRLKENIARMESMKKTAKVDIHVDQEEPQVTGRSPIERDLINSLKEIELEIKNLKTEAAQLHSQTEFYQTLVENTPKREQELMSLKRDYSNIQETYNSLLSRKLEADIAVNLERKQKGEQFSILDPAKAPMRPFKPNIQRILLTGIALGFALGFGFAYLRETMDTSVRRPEEIEALLQIPVLASLPFTYNQKELRKRKLKRIVTVVSILVAFIVLGVGMVVSLKGVDATVNFAKELFTKL
jgi:polysaccharide chain length determinant protein (PEP-CTERM system associated)